MKFRTDFVTNSSDSSFLTFNIQNKKLFDFLESLGIKVEGSKDGELTDRMIITLPSGERRVDNIVNGNEDITERGQDELQRVHEKDGCY